MAKKVLYRHTQPYQRYTVEDHGNNRYTVERFIIINNCWTRNLRIKTDKAGVDSALCAVNDSIIARRFF
jgi:hypothetical protein